MTSLTNAFSHSLHYIISCHLPCYYLKIRKEHTFISLASLIAKHWSELLSLRYDIAVFNIFKHFMPQKYLFASEVMYVKLHEHESIFSGID